MKLCLKYGNIEENIENILKILTNFSNIKIENLFIWVQVVSFSKTGYTTLHKLDKSRNLTPRRVKYIKKKERKKKKKENFTELLRTDRIHPWK